MPLQPLNRTGHGSQSLVAQTGDEVLKSVKTSAKKLTSAKKMGYVSQSVLEQQQSLINNYIKQVGELLGREQAFAEEKESLVQRVRAFERELEAAKNIRAGQNAERLELEERVRQAERQASRWHLKYNQLRNDLKETKDVILMYENLLDKLTEQNMKLKEWIKTRKQLDRENRYHRALEPALSELPIETTSFDQIQMPQSLNNTRIISRQMPLEDYSWAGTQSKTMTSSYAHIPLRSTVPNSM